MRSREVERFERRHLRSSELARTARESLLAGVPMPDDPLAGGFPVFAATGLGCRVEYLFRPMSPATTEADVDAHTAVFDGAARELAFV